MKGWALVVLICSIWPRLLFTMAGFPTLKKNIKIDSQLALAQLCLQYSTFPKSHVKFTSVIYRMEINAHFLRIPLAPPLSMYKKIKVQRREDREVEWENVRQTICLTAEPLFCAPWES